MATAKKLKKIVNTATLVEQLFNEGKMLDAMEKFDVLVDLIDHISDEMANLRLSEEELAKVFKEILNSPPKDSKLALKRKILKKSKIGLDR